MNSVKVELVSDENASRLELFIRIFWSMIVGFVLGFIGIFAAIALCLEWLHILFTGKRHAALQKFVNAYGVGLAQLKFYCMLSTDERPPIVPEF